MLSRPDPEISLELSHHQLRGSFVLLEDLSESVTRVGAHQPPVTAEWQNQIGRQVISKSLRQRGGLQLLGSLVGPGVQGAVFLSLRGERISVFLEFTRKIFLSLMVNKPLILPYSGRIWHNISWWSHWTETRCDRRSCGPSAGGVWAGRWSCSPSRSRGPSSELDRDLPSVVNHPDREL